MDFTEFVLSHLPPPPARLFEIGCGSGEVALELDSRGYEVVGVDPEAPAGPIFRRTTIEEFDDPRAFDAALASFSMHHVHDLDLALRRVVTLLAPDGVLIVDEFGWDLADQATLARYDIDPREWDDEHADLHRFRQLRDALGQSFEERYFSWELYFSRHLDAEETEERELIEAGEIRALGFRFVGSPR